jgi:hypothetical protein
MAVLHRFVASSTCRGSAEGCGLAVIDPAEPHQQHERDPGRDQNVAREWEQGTSVGRILEMHRIGAGRRPTTRDS